jgi:predicted PurR-regulated permease PerM
MSSRRLYAVLLVVGMLTAAIVPALVTIGPSGIAYACNGPTADGKKQNP